MTSEEEGNSPKSALPNELRNPLLLEDLFHVPDLLLDLAFHLFGGAFVLQIRIPNQFASLFLHRSNRLLDSTLCFILVA